MTDFSQIRAVYFGPRWDAPLLDHAVQVDTPAGQSCLSCGEPINDGDRGFIRPTGRLNAGVLVATPEPIHAECEMAGIIGHDLGICGCTGHPHGRATARLVWQRVSEKRGRPLEQLPGYATVRTAQ